MRLILFGIALLLLVACGEGALPLVVVYTSVDDVFARPIAERFERESGIHVQLVPDTEETKSTGLVARLIAERARPVADLFWSGDPARAALLKQEKVSEPHASVERQTLPGRYSDADGHWTGFSARARVLLYNTNLVAPDQAPKSIRDLVDARFRGGICIANPLFGTTSMHAAALFAVLGETRARLFFDDLIRNGGKVLASNSDVRRRVADGEFAIELTDSDDANVAMLEHKPVAIVFPDQDGIGTLLIPSCIVRIANGPHPKEAQRFLDFVLSAGVETELARSEAAQIPLRAGLPAPSGMPALADLRTMQVDYDQLARILAEQSRGFLKDWVARSR